MTWADCRPPSWWGRSVRDDSYSWYFEGAGTSLLNSAEALENAKRNALRQVVLQLREGLSPETSDYFLGQIQNWTVHEQVQAQEGRRHCAWVIIRYPREEYRRLQDFASGADARYRHAVQLIRQGDHPEAIASLQELEALYPLGAQPVFQTERALMLKGHCFEALEQWREARECYERVLNTVTEPAVHREAQAALERVRRRFPTEVPAQATTMDRSAIVEMLAAQEYRQALLLAELFVETAGASAANLELVARAHEGLGHLERALEYSVLAARAASPEGFRLFRSRAQTRAAQVFAQRCSRILNHRAGGAESWAVLLDPGIRAHVELAAFLRSLHHELYQAVPGMDLKDWLMLEEWLRESTVQPSAMLPDPERLGEARMEAGVEAADWVLHIFEGPGSEEGYVIVQGRFYGTGGFGIPGVKVLLRQTIPRDGPGSCPIAAIEERRFRDAVHLFDRAGNSTAAEWSGLLAELQDAVRQLHRGATVQPTTRVLFQSKMRELGSSASLWLTGAQANHSRVADLVHGILREWVDEVEANFASMGGGTQDLVAILNVCRDFDRATQMLSLSQRHPLAVRAYAEHAEMIRTEPPWGVAKDVWIDAMTGYSLEVEDRAFGIPFRLIPEGDGYFGDARLGKWVRLSAFYIQARETNNEDFLRFCDDRGWQVPPHLIRDTGLAQPEQPVTHVSWLDATRYAQWLGNQWRASSGGGNWRCELPTEAQWERAGRLHFPFDHPWGFGLEPGSVLGARRAGAPENAARLAADVSVAGVMGLAGNVREWCQDGWVAQAAAALRGGEVNPILGVNWESRKVVKGGCYHSQQEDDFQIWIRRPYEPGNMDRDLGFRVVVQPVH